MPCSDYSLVILPVLHSLPPFSVPSISSLCCILFPSYIVPPCLLNYLLLGFFFVIFVELILFTGWPKACKHEEGSKEWETRMEEFSFYISQAVFLRGVKTEEFPGAYFVLFIKICSL